MVVPGIAQVTGNWLFLTPRESLELHTQRAPPTDGGLWALNLIRCPVCRGVGISGLWKMRWGAVPKSPKFPGTELRICAVPRARVLKSLGPKRGVVTFQ